MMLLNFTKKAKAIITKHLFIDTKESKIITIIPIVR